MSGGGEWSGGGGTTSSHPSPPTGTEDGHHLGQDFDDKIRLESMCVMPPHLSFTSLTLLTRLVDRCKIPTYVLRSEPFPFISTLSPFAGASSASVTEQIGLSWPSRAQGSSVGDVRARLPTEGFTCVHGACGRCMLDGCMCLYDLGSGVPRLSQLTRVWGRHMRPSFTVGRP